LREVRVERKWDRTFIIAGWRNEKLKMTNREKKKGNTGNIE
jgi:hypothetical protein